MNRKFGEELSLLRKQRNMTLEEVSKITNYSVKRIRELEKNNGLPSVDLLNNLSSCYKANLNIYFSTNDINFPSEIFHIYLAFRDAIESFDIDTLKILIHKNEDRDCFRTGEGLKIILYAKGLICYSKKHYDEAKNLYEKALEINNVDIFNIKEQNIYYTDITFSILISYSALCYFMNNIEASKLILETLLDVFNDVYFNNERLFIYNTSFMIRIYLVILNNLASLYLGLSKYDEALSLINNSISFCQKYYRIGILVTLFSTKLEILHKQKKYNEAKKIASTIISYYELSNNTAKSDEFKKYLKKDYPNLLDYI